MTSSKGNSAPYISVIVPVYNEEDSLLELHDRLKNTLLEISDHYEIIFINDGSGPASLKILKNIAATDSNVFFVSLSRNFGHQIAVSAGLDLCRGEFVVIIDGDLQDPPEKIIEMHQRMQEGYDVVYAKRVIRQGESVFKKWSAKVFYRVLNKMTSIDIPLDTGDFRMISKKVVLELRNMPEQNKFLRGQIAWLGFKSAHILFDRDSRKHGKSAYPLSKMLRFAMDGITSFSDRPLAWVTRFGFIISLFSLIIILYAIYSHFVLERTVTGWTSLIISSMFIGGIQLISIGVIGEYISRINKNVLNRPLYIIEETNVMNEK